MQYLPKHDKNQVIKKIKFFVCNAKMITFAVVFFQNLIYFALFFSHIEPDRKP